MSTPLKPADATSSEIPVGRNRLEGKVVLVFGASSVGEGWASARRPPSLMRGEARR